MVHRPDSSHDPQFALNRNNDKYCTYPVSPQSVAAISWWSKDFKNLIEAWQQEARAALLNQYKHHFSFAINGPDHSILEPGVTATLAERVEQLRWLVDKCRELGQDPDASILVKVDPISVYAVAPNTTELLDNLDHVPTLAEYMKAFGLSRLHISFTQFSFPMVKSRLRKMASLVTIHEQSPTEQRALLESKVFPYTQRYGIKVQTCSAMDTVGFYRGQKSDLIVQGACVGWRDIRSITGGATDMAFARSGSASTRFCTCYPHRDVGDKSKGCSHGCRYCFSNPQAYEF